MGDPIRPDRNVNYRSLVSMAMSETATLKLRDKNHSTLVKTAKIAGLESGEVLPVGWLLFAITSRVWEIRSGVRNVTSAGSGLRLL
jgi:hypothetical protein